MGLDLLYVGQLSRVLAQEDLAVCNEATAQYGLTLTQPQMQRLTERRGEALKATGRVEFGRGVLRELIIGFCDSPYVEQDTYEETIADLQDVFYSCKEESEAAGDSAASVIPDDDLIEALRYAFDHEAAGSVEVLANLSVATLRAQIARTCAGDYNEQTQDSTFEEEHAHDKEESLPDELSRVSEDERWSRPGNQYAAGFYDSPHELYRIGFDSNSRIGGSAFL